MSNKNDYKIVERILFVGLVDPRGEAEEQDVIVTADGISLSNKEWKEIQVEVYNFADALIRSKLAKISDKNFFVETSKVSC